jgi:hypothetical protein
VTVQSAIYEVPLTEPFPPSPPQEEPPSVTAPAAGLPTRQCPGCGAVGTHYLTCASLRLPPGYRFSADPELHGPHLGASAPRPRSRPSSGGPDHPDWPRPPQP